jgi:hypothetical protein
MTQFLLQCKCYWYGTLAAWFTAAESVLGSNATADVVGEDAPRTSSSRFKKLIALL